LRDGWLHLPAGLSGWDLAGQGCTGPGRGARGIGFWRVGGLSQGSPESRVIAVIAVIGRSKPSLTENCFRTTGPAGRASDALWPTEDDHRSRAMAAMTAIPAIPDHPIARSPDHPISQWLIVNVTGIPLKSVSPGDVPGVAAQTVKVRVSGGGGGGDG